MFDRGIVLLEVVVDGFHRSRSEAVRPVMSDAGAMIADKAQHRADIGVVLPQKSDRADAGLELEPARVPLIEPLSIRQLLVTAEEVVVRGVPIRREAALRRAGQPLTPAVALVAASVVPLAPPGAVPEGLFFSVVSAVSA